MTTRVKAWVRLQKRYLLFKAQFEKACGDDELKAHEAAITYRAGAGTYGNGGGATIWEIRPHIFDPGSTIYLSFRARGCPGQVALPVKEAVSVAEWILKTYGTKH